MPEIKAADPASAGGALGLLSALGEHGGKRTRRVLTAIAVSQTARAAGRTWLAKSRAAHQYMISIPGDDALYPDVHAWVLDNLPARQRRAMTARTARRGSDQMATPAGSPVVPTRLRLFFDGTKAQTVIIGGHPIRIEVERPAWAGSGDPERDMQSWRAALERVIFTAPNAAGRDAVVAWLEQVAAEQSKRQPRLRIAGKWGGWSSREVPVRPLSSVILRAGLRERLLTDLERFLAAEADYARWGLPWHRGYLFHGVPGTGKTSTATALASHLGLDVNYIAIGSLDNDQALHECLNAIEPRSMLLLEDIDIVHGAKTRDDVAGGVTLAGLLNALDGMVTPHGVVTVLTTNDRTSIDPAMLRPGRVDLEAEMLPLNDAQLKAMCIELLGPGVQWHQLTLPRSKVVTPADVIGIFKDHLGDPPAAADHLLAYLGRDRS